MRAFSTVSGFEYRSTLGTAFWVGGDSAAEYLLHPVFLQFALLSLAVLALLDPGLGAGDLIGWQVPLIWLSVAVAGLIGAVALMAALAGLPKRMLGSRRFTPLLLLPLVALGEVVRAGMIVLLGADDWPGMPALLAGFGRMALVVLILDVMHALYVVPLHPLARKEPVRVPEVPDAVEEAAEPETAVDVAGVTTEEVRIADRTFALDEILWIRTEDHYLNVVTAKGRSLLRAKLSELQALQDGTAGLQVNRSHWVAFAAIREVQDAAGGQILLRLVTGDDTTVARSRRIMFRQMLQAWRSRREAQGAA